MAAAPQVALAGSAGDVSADSIRVGLIGAGLRGTNHLNNLLKREDVHVAAICDIDPARIELAKKKIKEAGKPEAAIFDRDEYDYRRLLESDLDAVVIATPWLWHTRMA